MPTLLKNACFGLAGLVAGNALAAIEAPQWLQWATVVILVAVGFLSRVLTSSRCRRIGLMLFGMAWAVVVGYVLMYHRVDIARIEANLWLEEMYPHYYWKLSPGGTRPRSYKLDETTLTSLLDNPSGHLITIMVHNGNKDTILYRPEIQVTFPDSIGVSLNPSPARPLGYVPWKPLDSRPPQVFWWAPPFTELIPGDDSSGPDGSLILKMPGVDIFPVSYLIQGTVKVPHEVAVTRRGTFWLATR